MKKNAEQLQRSLLAYGADTDNHELTDYDLELLAGGAGTMYQRLVSGVLVATLALGSLPMRAFAAQGDSGSAGAQAAQAVDQKALDAIDYAPDIAMSDIALPKGVIATKEGLKATKAASPDILKMLADAGFINWKNGSTAVDYTVDALGYVDESAEKVGKFGKGLFDIIKGGSTGDLESMLKGCKAFLKLSGAIGGDDGPSNVELMSEIKELNELLQGMCDKLDENTKQTYQNRLTIFDNAVGALDMECGKMEGMFKKAYEIADERGLLNQKEPARPVLAELPAEPKQPELPAEPTLTELPAKPSPADPLPEPKHPSNFSANDESWDFMVDEWHDLYGVDQMGYTCDYQLRVQQWQQAHAAWEGKCAAQNAEYDDACAAWQAECDSINAENEKLKADWQAECDRLNTEYDKQHCDWQTECDRINADNEKLEADYKAVHDEWKKNSNVSRILVKIMRDEHAAGNPEFLDYTSFMNSIRTNFETVAVECAKQGGASPFYAFDSYWAMYFNFDTQGYYLRRAYRTTAEYELKRAYALLGLYFDLPTEIAKSPDELKEPYSVALQKALNGIEALPVGNSPESVRGRGTGMANFFYNVDVHSYTLNRDFRRSVFVWSLASVGDNNHFSEAEVKAYCKRLHGRTVAEDLKLAGIMIDYNGSWNAWLAERGSKDRVSPQSYVGLGVRHKIEKGTWNTYYLPFDATGYNLRKYDEDPGTHQVLFLSPQGAKELGM